MTGRSINQARAVRLSLIDYAHVCYGSLQDLPLVAGNLLGGGIDVHAQGEAYGNALQAALLTLFS